MTRCMAGVMIDDEVMVKLEILRDAKDGPNRTKERSKGCCIERWAIRRPSEGYFLWLQN